MDSSPASMQARKGRRCLRARNEIRHRASRCGGSLHTMRFERDRHLGVITGNRRPDECFTRDSKGNRVPKHIDLVCLLKRALYGHPGAGTYWEQHAEKHLSSVGFVPIPDWKSWFRHPRLDLMLIVYVDDFKLAGPKCHLKEGWTRIRKGIITGEPEPIGRYLGCGHRVLETLIPAGGNPAHGSIPEPPPKSKTLKPLSNDDKVRAIQLQQRSETKKRKIDYERTSTPSGNIYQTQNHAL